MTMVINNESWTVALSLFPTENQIFILEEGVPSQPVSLYIKAILIIMTD